MTIDDAIDIAMALCLLVGIAAGVSFLAGVLNVLFGGSV